MLTFQNELLDPATRRQALGDLAVKMGIEIDEGPLDSVNEALGALLDDRPVPETTSEALEAALDLASAAMIFATFAISGG